MEPEESSYGENAVKWSDLGSFYAFFEEFPRDEKGNVVFNGGVLLDAASNLLYAD